MRRSCSQRLQTASAALLLLAIASGCALDPAEREYNAALRGEETGMSRGEQVAHLDRAIALAPRRGWYYETRAVYRIDMSEFDAARRDLDRDIALAPRAYAYYLRGLVACQSGQFRQSLADFDVAIARQPSNTQFFRGRSLARAAVNDARGALDDAEHLVREAPQQGESYYARGRARALLGHDREAVEDFDRAARIRPELVYVIEARVSALERLHQAARADSDRVTLRRLRAENAHCRMCFDPFRY